MPNAWPLSTGAGVIVAVIDTGIVSHADLDANVLAGYDFISDPFVANDGDGRDVDTSDPGDWFLGSECGVGYDSNSSWHGSHVAGTIAAVTSVGSNSGHLPVGISGIAYDAQILPVRVLGKCGGYLSDIVDGMIWASGGYVVGVPTLAKPAKVLNLSLGGGGRCSNTYKNAINIVRQMAPALLWPQAIIMQMYEIFSPRVAMV